MDAGTKRRTSGRIRRAVTKRLKVRGFIHGKTTFWARPRSHVIEFIHLHLFKFRPKFRAHCGIRVLNDSFDAAALNGPSSDDFWSGGSRTYDLAFEVDDGSIGRCVAAIDTFCVEIAEPWFERLAGREILVASASPLNERERRNLELSFRGEWTPAAVVLSKELLGVA